jgi:hypothetical protein
LKDPIPIDREIYRGLTGMWGIQTGGPAILPFNFNFTSCLTSHFIFSKSTPLLEIVMLRGHGSLQRKQFISSQIRVQL